MILAIRPRSDGERAARGRVACHRCRDCMGAAANYCLYMKANNIPILPELPVPAELFPLQWSVLPKEVSPRGSRRGMLSVNIWKEEMLFFIYKSFETLFTVFFLFTPSKNREKFGKAAKNGQKCCMAPSTYSWPLSEPRKWCLLNVSKVKCLEDQRKGVPLAAGVSAYHLVLLFGNSRLFVYTATKEEQICTRTAKEQGKWTGNSQFLHNGRRIFDGLFAEPNRARATGL